MVAGRDAARRDLINLQNKLRQKADYDDRTECRVSLLEGPVADRLLDCARTRHIDVMVVGTHGRGGFGKAILGSVAEKLFRHACAPVLTIGPKIRHGGRLTRLRHILAPCDLSPKSHPAVEYACSLAAAQDARLTVLHVAERASEDVRLDPERVKESVRDRLKAIVGARGDQINVNYRVEFGPVAASILSAASHLDADLIVLGVHPSTGPLDRFMWPIAYELVRESTCPVLTVRRSRSTN
jgi:nucleotide-binding universal stress UspA family protein